MTQTQYRSTFTLNAICEGKECSPECPYLWTNGEYPEARCFLYSEIELYEPNPGSWHLPIRYLRCPACLKEETKSNGKK